MLANIDGDREPPGEPFAANHEAEAFKILPALHSTLGPRRQEPMPPRHHKSKTTGPLDPEVAREAKAVVALAFRNGPIEDVHAGVACPTCQHDTAYSRISDAEMKTIMQNAVNHMYRLLWLKTNDPVAYDRDIQLGHRYVATWDDPET